MITFAQPLYIVVGLSAVFLLWLLMRYVQLRQTHQLEIFAASPLLKQLLPGFSKNRRLIKNLLILATTLFCFLALARPQYDYRWIDVKHKGIDILFALDTSKSMLVEDVRPNRLERAKYAIMDFVGQLEGDRVGLMVFAGSSFLICPMTADYTAFEQSLSSIDTTIVPVGGTDISSAVESAEKILHNDANHKILILITDGENLEGNVIASAKKAGDAGMTIFTVGVGTREGELIPDKTTGGFLKDSSGSFVKSRLDEIILRDIAQSTNGFYVPLGTQGEGLEKIYQEKLHLIPKMELAEKRKKIPIERYQYPLAIALILLVFEYLTSPRTRSAGAKGVLTRFKTGNTGIHVLLFMIAPTLFYTTPVLASPSDGSSAYNSGQYIRAGAVYQELLEKHPDDPILSYNLATTSYKNNLFDEAIRLFEKSLHTDDVRLQEKGFFNKGNSYYRKGEQLLSTDQKATVEHWEQALLSYENTLSLNPDNENARFNRDLVQKKLEALKKQQPPPENNQKDQKNNQQEKESESPANQEKQSGEDHQEQQDKPEDSGNSESTQQETPADNSGNQQDRDKGDQQQGSRETTDTEEQPVSPEKSSDSSQSQKISSVDSNDAVEMTQEEAEKLLQAVQDEEGRLNLFTPHDNRNDNQSQKDW